MGQICSSEGKKEKNIKYKKIITKSYPGYNKKKNEDIIKIPNSKKQIELPEQSFRQVTIEDFEIIQILGKGAFAKVFLVKEKQTGKTYALKTITKSEIGDSNIYNKQERQILTYMESDFIIKLYYAFQDPYKLYMVIDFVEYGDLQQHLKKRGKFSEEETKFIMCEVLIGMQHLHERGVVYRDLKPSNILIDANGHIKLADFGISKIEYSEKNQAKTFCGTYQYMAPEIFQNQGYGYAADYYSFGVTMYELLTGNTPFDKYQNEGDIVQEQVKQENINLDDIQNVVLKDLLENILSVNPKLRNQNIQNDLYFQDIDWESIKNRKSKPVYQPAQYCQDNNIQLSCLSNNDLTEIKDQQCEEQGYFVNFSFNCDNKQLYEMNEELGNDSDEDVQYFSRMKFLTRKQTLLQGGLTKQFTFDFKKEQKKQIIEQREQDNNNVNFLNNEQNTQKDIKDDKKSENTENNRSYRIQSLEDNNKNTTFNKNQNFKKYGTLKQEQQTVRLSNLKPNKYINQVCVIKDIPYEESRKQFSVQYNKDQYQQFIQKS